MIFDDITVCAICGKKEACDCQLKKEQLLGRYKSYLYNRRSTLLRSLFYKFFKLTV
jgi:hypothetical protein